MKLAIAGVPLAQFAAVNAALAEAFPLRAVLAVEEIDAARWAEADTGWSEELTRDPALMARYEAELARAQARLLAGDKKKLVRSGAGVGATPNGDPGAQPAGPPPPTFLTQQPIYVAPPPPVEDDAGARAPVAEVPFAPQPLPPDGPPRAATIPLPEPGTTVAFRVTHVGADASRRVLPFRAAGSASAPPAEPAAPPRPRTLPGTDAAGDLALPFRSSPPVPAPPPPRPPPPPRLSDDELTQPAFTPPSGRLPFQAAAAAPPAAEPVAEPSPYRGSIDRETTKTGIALPALVLPFRDSEVLAAAPAPAAPQAAPYPGSIREPADDDEALEPSFHSSVWSAPAAPFAAPPPPEGAPLMPLERHASICLEMALDPSRPAEVLARYQITAEEKARADAYYRAQIAADRELGARWHQAYAAYHAWFTANARPRS